MQADCSRAVRGAVAVLRREDVAGLELHGGEAVRDALPAHSHEELMIGHVAAGARSMRVGGKSLVLAPGSSFVVAPGAVHTGASIGSDGWTFRVLYVPFQIAREVWEELGGTGVPRVGCVEVAGGEVAPRFGAASRAAVAGAPALELLTRVVELVATLFSHASALRAAPVPAPSRAIGIVRDYLEANAAETISLDQLTAIAQLSKFHLIRRFRASVGMSPHVYQLHVRVRWAKEMIARGATLGEAAVETGFADQSHLNRHFRRIVGLTPGEYRRSLVGSRERLRDDGHS